MSADGASYRDAGVDYDALDSAKRLAMLGALSTSGLLESRGGRALDASRGEPAFVFELGERTLALVLEGLGTKSLIARAVLEQQGLNRFLARRLLLDKVEALKNGYVSAERAAMEKIRRQKRRRSRRAKQRMLADKSHHAAKKEARRPVRGD